MPFSDFRGVFPLFQKHSLAACIKAGLELQGFEVGDPIPPQLPLDAAARRAIGDALTRVGALYRRRRWPGNGVAPSSSIRSLSEYRGPPRRAWARRALRGVGRVGGAEGCGGAAPEVSIAATCPPPTYQRRQPGGSVLYRTLAAFTGRQHAGENLAAILAQRAADLAPPIQMCDALPTNTAGDFDTLLANCLAHARRRFVDVVDHFPAEVRHVLETLREVYRTDARARERALSPEERLHLHQTTSGPLMTGLETWLHQQLDDHLVEPNSGLGAAIAYMLEHWAPLTLFLRVAGAPLDNNVCERALKKAILHRKNALFYKTPAGARVGDVFISLIHTAELNGIPPFAYLVALQRHHQDVALAPSEWLPWNYEATLTDLRARASPSR